MKKKIIFIQPPTQLINFDIVRENTMTAAGYLISWYIANNNNNKYEFIIMPSAINDYAGDCALINSILSLQPAAVCFSCYCWNISRIKYLARTLKQTNPEIKIIFGGPEIVIDNTFLLEDNYADFLVTGEGEQIFEQILKLNFNTPDSIRGLIFVEEKGKYFTNGFYPLINNIDKIQSPYITGILKPEENGFMRFETQRGCARHCGFCYYGKGFGKPRQHSFEYIEKLLKYVSEKNINEIFLLDPDFLNRKDIKLLLKKIEEYNSIRTKKIEYHTELDAEKITDEIANNLGKANLISAEIGLQSINTKSLKKIGRILNLEKFTFGAKNLKKYDIKPKIDVIIGLPGETEEDVKKTLEYLAENEFGKEAQIFNLAVLPGTQIRKDAEKYGIERMFYPPYYCIETPDLSTEQLQNLFWKSEDLFDVEFDPIETPSFVETNNSSNKEIKSSHTEIEIIDKIVILLSSLKTNYQKQLKDFFEKYTAQIGNNFCLWIKDYEKKYGAALIDCIAEITEKNQHTVFDYIIEIKEPVEPADILKIFELEKINENHYLNNYYFFNFDSNTIITSKKIVLYPFEDYYFKKKYLNALAEYFYLIPLITDIKKINMQALKRYASSGQDIVIRINKESLPEDFIKTFYIIMKECAEFIHFTDYELEKERNIFLNNEDVEKYNKEQILFM